MVTVTDVTDEDGSNADEIDEPVVKKVKGVPLSWSTQCPGSPNAAKNPMKAPGSPKGSKKPMKAPGSPKGAKKSVKAPGSPKKTKCVLKKPGKAPSSKTKAKAKATAKSVQLKPDPAVKAKAKANANPFQRIQTLCVPVKREPEEEPDDDDCEENGEEESLDNDATVNPETFVMLKTSDNKTMDHMKKKKFKQLLDAGLLNENIRAKWKAALALKAGKQDALREIVNQAIDRDAKGKLTQNPKKPIFESVEAQV